jgi:hypothetical protein
LLLTARRSPCVSLKKAQVLTDLLLEIKGSWKDLLSFLTLLHCDRDSRHTLPCFSLFPEASCRKPERQVTSFEGHLARHFHFSPAATKTRPVSPLTGVRRGSSRLITFLLNLRHLLDNRKTLHPLIPLSTLFLDLQLAKISGTPAYKGIYGIRTKSPLFP